MNTRFSVSNFRAFDEKGVCVDLRPITILTGCNSSGKSSLVKSLLLINDFIKCVNSLSEGETPKLDFGRKPMSLMGNFETVLNNDAVSNGNETMKVSYDVKSPFIGITLTVSFEFGLDKKDLKKDGFVKRVRITDPEGNILMTSRNARVIENYLHPDHRKYREPFGQLNVDYGEYGTHLSAYKKHFFALGLTVFALNVANGVYTEYLLDGGATESEVKDKIAEVRDYLNELKEILGKDSILSSIDYYSNQMRDASEFLKSDAKLLEQAAKTGILTYMPILEQLDHYSKDSFAKEFSSLCNKAGIASFDRIERIITSFLKSPYSKFSDYYRYLEDGFLNNNFYGNDFSDLEDIVVEPVQKNNFDNQPETEEKYPLASEIINFDKVFRLLCSLNPKASGVRIIHSKETPETYYNHTVLKDFAYYRARLVKDVLSCDVCESLTYVGSSRINVQRLYSMDVQDSFGHTVSEYFEAIRNFKGDHNYIPGTFINKWLSAFGIGEQFEIETLGYGLGVVLKVYKHKEDKEGKLLADFGYGISQLISIMIEIETAILSSEEIRASAVVDYSKGVADIFGVFNAKFENARKPRTIAIEEPEIHQHPNFQSKLAEMFVDAMNTYNIQFILETHSEYLVRKLQNLVAKSVIPREKVALLYVNESPDSAGGKIRQIEIAEDGRLQEPFGPGFFDEADSLAMNLLMIKGGLV